MAKKKNIKATTTTTETETAERTGQRVGYIRVSSVDQNTERQLDGEKLDKVFEDRCSGKDTNRPQLQALIEYVRDGDTVVVHSLDRLARNLNDLRNLVDDFTGRGVKVQFIKGGLPLFSGDESSTSTLLLSIMGAFAEFERSLIRERQREGIAIAKTKGMYKGRKKAVSADKREEIRKRVADGAKQTALAKEFGVSRETIRQYLKG